MPGLRPGIGHKGLHRLGMPFNRARFGATLAVYDRATTDRNVRGRAESARRRHGGRLHPLRQMCRGLPGHGSRRLDGRAAAKSGACHRRHHRHRAPRPGQRGRAQMGERVPPLRRMHQGLRLRRQSALPALHGAHRDGARQGDGGAAPRRRRSFPQGRGRGEASVADATRRRAVGAAGPGRQQARDRRETRFRVLHRLQRAQDAAHRAVGARHHGFDRRHL